MKARIISGRAVILLLAGFVQMAVLGSSVESGEPDWWKAQSDVVVMLMEQRTDIAELVSKVTASKPKTGYETLVKLSVLMRAGMTEAACRTVDELEELCPDLGASQISQIYYQACDHFEAWEVAQRMAEAYADNVMNLSLENRLLKHFDGSGWTFEEIDGWLAEMPAGHDSFWVKQRLRFHTVHGRAEKLVRELEDGVRDNPQDIDRAAAVRDVLMFADQARGEKWELSWLAELVKPKRAREAERIASRLQRLKQWNAASTFYSKAIEIPMTDKEATDIGMTYQAFMSVETLRAGFEAHVREGLAEALMKMGRNAEAQKWMVGAADIREEHNLGMNAVFAGAVQAASGARVIEGRIKEEERESKDDPKYWRKRAQYYGGRNEPDKQEEALRKALALTKPLLLPERRSKGYADMRSLVLWDYSRFLTRMNRDAEAVALLRKEISEVPAASESAKRAARLLAFDFEKLIRADDEVLWRWLGNRTRWEHRAKRLLWRMPENANRAEIDKYFSRAENLVEGTDPSKASKLGWIMNRMGHAKRSVRLLEYAVEKADDEEVKEEAGFALFESYLDVGDWARAEQIFPQARKRLTPTEAIDWYARIAVAAVAGKEADAMRIWRVAANANPARPTYLRRLARRGLREELAAFFSELAKKLPESDAPAKALSRLEEE